MKICVDCFRTQEELSKLGFYRNCPKGLIGGSDCRMFDHLLWCVRCREPFISRDFYGNDLERCESKFCRGYRKGYAEAIKASEHVLFPIPKRQCKETDSCGYRCEQEAGHDPPCACPKALKRYLSWKTAS